MVIGRGPKTKGSFFGVRYLAYKTPFGRNRGRIKHSICFNDFFFLLQFKNLSVLLCYSPHLYVNVAVGGITKIILIILETKVFKVVLGQLLPSSGRSWLPTGKHLYGKDSASK